MHICIVTPAPPRSYQGNRVTAERWRELFQELGHSAQIVESYEGQRCDTLIALHARRSAASVLRFVSEVPRAPVIVALTGTDLYPDLARSGVDLSVLEAAERLVVLQDRGVGQIPEPLRDRTRVIVQSADLPEPGPAVLPEGGSFLADGVFAVAVLAHLRPVKDPLLAAAASRMLPAESTIRIVHLGAELDTDLGEQARAETGSNPRYRWLGEVPHDAAMRMLGSCRLLALTSLTEGGANAVCEAIAAGVPVVSSLIDGSLGLLGSTYPGYFPPGDAAGLADLLWRVENDDGGLLGELRRRCEELRPLVARHRERQAWDALLGELAIGSSPRG